MSNKIKSDQLGMPFGTASNRLRKTILFHLLQKHGENVCYMCSNVIENASELSIEHKEPWLHSVNPIELFFDIENIAFSHLKCNTTNRSRNTLVVGESKYKGVTFENDLTRKKKWRAEIFYDGKNHKIGRFISEEEAAIAYNDKAIEVYGRKAILNNL